MSVEGVSCIDYSVYNVFIYLRSILQSTTKKIISKFYKQVLNFSYIVKNMLHKNNNLLVEVLTFYNEKIRSIFCNIVFCR